MPAPIYLDYNATTPVDPAVVDAMLPAFAEHFGNPSSDGHAFGWVADELVVQGREQVAAALGARPETVVFTGGATEAVNLAIRGAAEAYRGKRDHIITAATEHKAVLEACEAAERDGARVTVLGVGSDGLLDLDELRAALTDETLMVAVMWANNETGVIQPIRAIADLAHERDALMMTDATQTLGKVPVDVEAVGVDLLACSAHKCYGPKGVGALYRRRRRPRVRLAPLLVGGGHEDGLRSGTLNVPGIVGFGKAAELAASNLDNEAARLAALRDRLEAALLGRFPEARVNGTTAHRLSNTTNLTFPGVRTRDLLPAMRGVAVSTGSACQTKAATPSHVLTAMGLSEADAFASVRFSVGRFTTDAEIDLAIDDVAAAVEQTRPEPAAA
ncbi:MAG: cysteine desulfurase family protein [Bacteroidota bacterium]